MGLEGRKREYCIVRARSNKKALSTRKEGCGWLSLSPLVCAVGLGLSLRAVAPSQSSTYLWGFPRKLSVPTVGMFGETVDQDALPTVGQMMSNWHI